MRQVVRQSVDAHAGDGDGHGELADKALGLRAHPAHARAEVARRRQQQDDGDGRDGVQKSFHGVTSVLRNSYTSITRLRQKTRDEKDGCNAGSDTL